MFCSICGKALVKGALFCGECGARLQANAGTVVNNQISPPSPAPKRGKGPVIAICAVVAAVILGGGAVFAYNMLKDNAGAERNAEKRDNERYAEEAKKISENPQEYLAGMLGGLAHSLIDNTSELSQSVSNMPAGMSATGTSGKLDISFSMNAGESLINKLAAEFYEIDEIRGLLKIVLDSGLSFGAAYDIGARDLRAAFDLKWLLGRNNILSADTILDGNDLYLGIPELYDKYIYMDLSDFGFDTAMILDGFQSAASLDIMDGFSYELTEVMEPFTALQQLLETRDAVIKKLADDIIRVVLAEIKNVTFNKNVGVSVNDKNVSYNEIAVNLTEKDAMNALAAALKIFKGNEAYLDLIADLMNIMDDWTYYSRNDILEWVDEALDELADADPAGNEAFLFKIYLDAKTNQLTGFSTDIEDAAKIKAFFDLSNGYEFHINDYSGMEMRIRGKLNGTADHFYGDLWIYYNEYGEVLNMRVMDFSIKSKPDLDVKFTFHLGEIINAAGEMRDELPYAVADIMDNMELSVSVSSGNKGFSAAMELNNPKENISARLSASFQNDAQPSIKIPDKNNAVHYMDLEYILERDIDKVLGNISDLFEKIEKMGYDVSMISDVLSDMLYYIY